MRCLLLYPRHPLLRRLFSSSPPVETRLDVLLLSSHLCPPADNPLFGAAVNAQKVDFEVGGNKFSISVSEARKNFDFMSAQVKKLAEDQATLDDTLKNAKSTATEKMDAQNRVNEDLENINGEIKIAQNNPKNRHGGGGGRSATERERVGVGAPQVANLQKQTLDVTKMQLIEARKLNTQMDLLIKSGRGNNDLNNF